MEPWQKEITESVSDLNELSDIFPVDTASLQPVVERYPMRITRYYLSLIKQPGDPIWLQCVPDLFEIKEDNLSHDPLDEEKLSPVPRLIHRYPDRVVLLTSSVCPMFCRFCMRKLRFACKPDQTQNGHLSEAIEYIDKNKSIRDVILSGGDPFMLTDETLDDILTRLRRAPHVEIIRINTRAPVTLPERITPGLCAMLKKYHPVYVSTHFNHPVEITRQSAEACARLADAGIPLGNQTVLLKGVNDSPEVMTRLMQKLLTIRVKPYYIHQLDRVKATGHFRVHVEQGLKIMAGLRGHTSGMAVPYYVIDLPGGKGKVPILPDDVKRLGKTITLRNYRGEIIEYPEEE
jgi:lysine 2,3-aminomutase